MAKGRVVAIDGPSGAGKSTIAKCLAKSLNFHYLDTGSLYRAVGLYLKDNALKDDASDEDLVIALRPLGIVYREGSVFVNGEDYSQKIRTPEAGHYASVFSTRGPVREFLLDIQRGFAEEFDLVAEGRDMTTVVFPNAWKKFYLDASEEDRALRRFNQLKELGNPITYEDALRDVRVRDIRDKNREIAPLRIAEDAIYIDTTGITIEAVLDRILKIVAP